MAACIRPKKTSMGKKSYEDVTAIGTLSPQHKNIIQVYTDWANHYLDKVKCKKHIQDLQVDVADGVVLADVIEAVSK
ncbi:hypothetical protein RUM44_013130 [Polyplax serrata]|uniref:Calponin-homology (CH) domain-containing protein n=1 Tax=Polyplax serrata TaxID=468196 RepID=A0ABR1BF81_POLSC